MMPKGFIYSIGQFNQAMIYFKYHQNIQYINKGRKRFQEGNSKEEENIYYWNESPIRNSFPNSGCGNQF